MTDKITDKLGRFATEDEAKKSYANTHTKLGSKDLYKHLKYRLPQIKMLNMLKMEKNFIVMEKGYDRQPYLAKEAPLKFWVQRIKDETKELEDAIERKDISNMKEELADLSNIIDYIFEKVTD
jgi:hypothetical protein